MTRIFHSRLMLIPLGIVIGLIVRFIFGAPSVEDDTMRLDPYSIEKTVNEERPSEALPREPLIGPLNENIIEVPMWRDHSNVATDDSIPLSVERWLAQYDQYSHDADATFHAHGKEICASGCAASNHPTELLTEAHFRSLVQKYSRQPLNEESDSLEELLFFGPQTLQMIDSIGLEPLDFKRASFLSEQLRFGHARVSIRLVDENGIVRSWNEPTRVPFDRRHVFEMKTRGVQELVTSGTVKRVGLHHIWVRL